MKNKLIIIFLILLGILLRLAPHEPNIVPIGTITLFSANYLPKKYSWSIALIIMLITDAFLGFHSMMIWVYGSYLLISLLNRREKSIQFNYKRLITMTLFSSVLFYLITNFGVWISTNLYTKNLQGLDECYFLALPFFRNTLMGDMFYNTVFFGGYNYLKNTGFVKKRRLGVFYILGNQQK
jgi:hypothetical protein